jgi:glycosyltransferase involved in cell wall biosynthesis
VDELAPGGWMRSVARTVFGWPDVLVLLSSAERPQFERLGGVRRMVVIPNAVDTVALGGRDRAHSGAVRRLAYLGRLNGDKGELESVDAVALLRGESGFEGLELSFAGSGPAQPALEERIAKHGLEDRVRLLGAIHGDAKTRFLREADLLLLPTYHPEGLPYAILESLAAGTPVVTTRNGGIPDVVVDRETGVFVEPRDPAAIAAALRELASSPERLRAMSRACAGYAERELGLERLARQFGALYRELIAG